MASKKKVFFLGATGYIGGAVFVKLVKTFDVTALIRDKSKAAKLEELGAKTVVASMDDKAVLEREAEHSDIVINTADADNLEACVALTTGLKKRGHSGAKPIYIHVSGTGCIVDNANGQFAADKIFDDSVRADVHDNIKPEAWHRKVDQNIFEVGRTGQVDCYILCPPLIYGEGSCPFNKESIQVPGLIRAGLAHKRAVHVGKGANIWSNVHVEDLADFFVILLEKSIAGTAPKNDDGFYFTENGSNNFKEVTDTIGQAMLKRGLSKDSTSEDVEQNVAEIIPGLIAPATAHNSRCRAVKARQLGWKPHRPALMATLDETVDRISREKK